jgi:hypothetical protein
MMMQRIGKKKYANKTCTQKIGKNSNNSNARTPPTHVQTRTQKCEVKENHFLKPQNLGSTNQISMQSCNKVKGFRSALKGSKVFPRG